MFGCWGCVIISCRKNDWNTRTCLDPVHSTARDMLYKRILNDIRGFGYLDPKELKFVLRIVIHKIEEFEKKG